MFPASPRRLALARQAGLTPASPLLVCAVACGAALVAAIAVARAASVSLGAWIADACALRPGPSALRIGAALELATPIVASAALAGAVAHVAQTRTLWLPRRRVDGAPAPAVRPVARAAWELVSAGTVGAVTLGWLWWAAPRMAILPGRVDGAALVASFATTLLSTLAALALVDAVTRHLAHARALRMTPAEKRSDDRLAAADPRWRDRRRQLTREPAPSTAVAGAVLLLLGDDAAIAIEWDPVRQPIPHRTATARGPRAMQLLGLARRYRVPVHRDVELARSLAEHLGAVPEPAWARLAEIVAATRGRV
jgi:flagellar biosynthesis protein FlhB